MWLLRMSWADAAALLAEEPGSVHRPKYSWNDTCRLCWAEKQALIHKETKAAWDQSLCHSTVCQTLIILLLSAMKGPTAKSAAAVTSDRWQLLPAPN